MGVVGLLGLVLAGTACDPKEDPIATELPPRDTGGAAIRRVTIEPEDIDAYTYAHRANIANSGRTFVGAWEGLEARTFIQFDPDSFLVSSEGDTLAGATVLDASLSFNCVPGQGDPELSVALAGVAPGAENAWQEDSLYWPGPATLAEMTTSVLPNCETEDDFPEREVEIPIALVESWISDPEANNGLALIAASGAPHAGAAFGDPGAMLQIATSENAFAFLDSVGSVSTPPGPRMRFRAALDGGAGDTVSVFLGSTRVTGDAYAVSPDMAELPCTNPDDCLQIGRGVTHRSIFRLALPDLPRGTNVHRATLTMRALGHPRSDAAIAMEIFRLTSEWPDGMVVDSLVTTSGVLWHTATFDSAATSVEIPVTELVQAWYDRAFDNEGFLVRAALEDASATTESFAGPTHPTVALRPRVEIVYTTPFGGRP